VFILSIHQNCDKAGALTSVVLIRRSAAEAAASFCIRSYSYISSLSWILSLSTNACTVRHIIQDPLVITSSIRLSVCLSVCPSVCLSGLIWSVCLSNTTIRPHQLPKLTTYKLYLYLYLYSILFQQNKYASLISSFIRAICG
jgi:hypothetical protein